ncbi:MAG: TonB family protein [Bacteroidota bacterium]
MKKLIIWPVFVLLFGLNGYGQNEEKIPDVNEFVFADQEPDPQNLSEVREAIGYPEEARKANIEGNVVVRILVDPDGNYVNHKLIAEADRSLGRAVELHVNKLRFTPAQVKGENIHYWVNIPFAFKLLDQDHDKITARIDSLTELLSVDPENYRIWHQRGVQRSMLKEFEDAKTDFTESIRLNPRKNKKKKRKNTMDYLVFAHYSRASIFLNREKYDEAIADYTEAIRIADELALEDSSVTATLPNAYLERGFAYTQKEDYAAAKPDYRKVIAMDPDKKCTVYPLLSDIGLVENNFAELVEFYSGLIECDTANKLLHYSRGFYRLKSDDPDGAIADFEETLRRNQSVPIRLASYNQMAQAYLAKDDAAKAMEQVEAALGINVLNPQAYFVQGLVHEKNGDTEKACEAWKKAVRFDLEGEERTQAIEKLTAACGGFEEDE